MTLSNVLDAATWFFRPFQCLLTAMVTLLLLTECLLTKIMEGQTAMMKWKQDLSDIPRCPKCNKELEWSDSEPSRLMCEEHDIYLMKAIEVGNEMKIAYVKKEDVICEMP